MTSSILTVTGAAASRDLCTLAAVKAELGISTTTFDVDLAGRIVQASAAIESYCSCAFPRETVQEVFRPERPISALLLSRSPVSSITSIAAGAATLVDGTDFEADLKAGIVFRLCSDERYAWRDRKITVVYAAGYILPGNAGENLPSDIQRACILTVASAHLGRGRDAMIRSESAQDVGLVSYLDPRAEALGLPPQAAAMLKPHQAVTI